MLALGPSALGRRFAPGEGTSVRDYLLTLICINNGSRSGSLANMTLEEFKNAHKDEDDHVVKVKNIRHSQLMDQLTL